MYKCSNENYIYKFIFFEKRLNVETMGTTYALITGASQGIGKEIAVSLAKHGYNLLLAARSADKLKELKSVFEKEYRATVDSMTVDLSTSAGAEALEKWVLEKEYDVSVLVNNAGYGFWSCFFPSSYFAYTRILDDAGLLCMHNAIHSFIPVTPCFLPLNMLIKPYRNMAGK